MTRIFQRPVMIAAIVAALSIITMGVVNHTDLVVDHRPRGISLTPIYPPVPNET
jgi:hypothetical protein